MVDSLEQQVVDILRLSPSVVAAMRLTPAEEAMAVRGRILAQPLKRAGMVDIELAANDPTPQCFDPFVPYWVRPSMSVYQSLPGGSSRSSRYMEVRITVAYYASPDDAETRIWAMRSAAMRAVEKRVIRFPDGMGASLWPTHDMSAIEEAPEFPGAGKVMIERVSALAVWRRT